MALAGFWLAALMLCRFTNVLASDVSSEIDITGDKDSSSDGVRCYCNSAECVSTSYMCRAPGSGGCYSELSPQAKRHDGRYGCIHQLAETAEEAMHRCQNAPAAKEASSSEVSPAPVAGMYRHQTLLLCCFEDLCNHEDSPLARRRLNLTTQEESSEGTEGSRSPGYGSGEVWFKAATIAVPVCGAVILFLLVGVAVRLLRADAADIKLRNPYIMSHAIPPPAAPSEVKKALGHGTCGAASPLLVAPGGCLVHVERAELASVQLFPDCDIQR